MAPANLLRQRSDADCARAGVDRSYISLLETATYSASIDMLAKLGKALKVDAAEFLKDGTRKR